MAAAATIAIITAITAIIITTVLIKAAIHITVLGHIPITSLLRTIIAGVITSLLRTIIAGVITSRPNGAAMVIISHAAGAIKITGIKIALEKPLFWRLFNYFLLGLSPS